MRIAQASLRHADDSTGNAAQLHATAVQRDDAQHIAGLHDPVVIANLQQFIASIGRHFAAAATTAVDDPWRACDRRRRRC